MSDPLSITALVQERMIRGNLNATMLQNLLMGIYTIVYGYTMYLYVSRKKRNTRIVIWMTTILYILNLIDFVIYWYCLNQSMVANGATQETTFLATIDGVAPSLFIFETFIFYSAFAVSDALLLWRCYHVWGMSRRIVAVPTVLFVAECGLLLASVALSVSADSPTLSNANFVTQYNNVVSAYVFISLATTVVSTSLIGYRIHKSVAFINGSTSKRRYTHIMTMILESAAIYSVALLVLAMSTVIPSFTYVGSPADIAEYYTNSFVAFIAGMAPTILVARIALKGDDTGETFTPTLPHIPDLELASGPPTGERKHEEPGVIFTEPRDPPSAGNQCEVRTNRSGMVGSENAENV